MKCSRCGRDCQKRRSRLCRDCYREYARDWRRRRKAEGRPVVSTKLPLSYHVEYGKAYRQRQDVKKKRAAAAARARRDPAQAQKILARQLAANAIRRGDIKKRPCEVCGATKAQAHHDDYSKPLAVRWLCAKHHHEVHAKAKAVCSAK